MKNYEEQYHLVCINLRNELKFGFYVFVMICIFLGALIEKFEMSSIDVLVGDLLKRAGRKKAKKPEVPQQQENRLQPHEESDSDWFKMS